MAEYKDVEPLKKQIADFKRVVNSQNGDYLTGYISALSVTEGIIATLPAADVVEVVRCKDCKRFVVNKEAHVTYCNRELKHLFASPDDFCSMGERKEG